MFKRYFLAGFVALAPFVLTLYFFYWLVAGAERLFHQVWLWAGAAELYRPGYGIVVAILLIFMSGILVQAWGFRQLYAAGGRLLERIPVIKMIYSGLSSVMDMLAPHNRERKLSSAVLVNLGDDLILVGFLTQNDPQVLIPQLESGRVAVYMPMSYQIGGYTVLVKPDRLTHLDMPLDAAMRLAVTGMVGNEAKDGGKLG